jgi:hypothetical protein
VQVCILCDTASFIDVDFCLYRVGHTALLSDRSLVMYIEVSPDNVTEHSDAENFIVASMCIHGTCAADGPHQTSTQSPLMFKHLSLHGTKACVPE